MNCSRCQHDNREGRRFCARCGASLGVTCASCEFYNEPGDEFCGGCGKSLTPVPRPAVASLQAYTPKHLADKILKARSALEGERRQVTVLFADLVGFTSFAETLDPEEVHAIINRCFELITAEVHRLEGTINQYTGDGVMALFGAPIAHEDAPRRAVHAALGVQRAIRDYGRELQARQGSALEMRIGLNTGPVVVGKIGDDLRMDYTAVGDTSNLAARLQQAARPGTVLVSEATHRAIAGFFETLDMGELSLKGHAPVRAFEVVRARRRKVSLEVEAERDLTPFVGRARELDTLVDLFHRVKAGHGQVVSVTGEAGIGKSRLVYELRRRLAAAGEDVTWREGRCVSFGQAIPFLPLIEQLRENFGIEEHDGEPEIIAKIEHGMRRMGGLEAHTPYICYLLAVDPGDPAIAAMDAPARRKKILDASRALALRGATFRLIVFVFEDLHWVDTSTEEHIASLVDSLAGVPIMLVLTYRTGYTPRFGPRTFHTALTLRSLGESDTFEIASHILGAERFPEGLRALLMDKGEGVPLFVEEVTKTLLDLGILRRDNGGFQVVERLVEAIVPETIQGIIMARLDRLGEDGKRTVQLASVIGRQFLRRLLERISGLTGQLEGVLAELKALEIIYEAGLLPDPAYIFKHAVIQDVAYQSLLKQRRKDLHGAVALAIEELYPERLAEHYAELAHHFAQAEEWRKAAQYADLVGQRAANAFANVEAAAHYGRALEATSRMTPPPEPRELAGLHVKHGAVLMILGQYEKAVAEYERALELARRVSDRKLETEILTGLGGVYSFYHRPEQAVEHLTHALGIARETGDRASQAVCLAISAFNRGACGWSAGIESDVEEVLRLAPEVANPRSRARTLAYCGVVLQWRGDYDRVLPILQEAAGLAESSHAGFEWALAMSAAATARAAKGDYEDALATYRRLRDYATGAGDKFFLTRAPNFLGGVHLELFDLDEAIRLCLEGDEACQQLSPWPEPRAHSLLKVGLGHLGRGELGLAGEFFGRAWALLDHDLWGRWRWHIALLRARGELALAFGRHDEAWDFAVQSLEMATETHSRKHVVRAQQLQAEILAARGQQEAALEPLRAAVTLAERLGTSREIWTGRATLGRVFARLGRDADAEASFTAAAQTIESIAGRLTTPRLRQSFLNAEPVTEVFRALGRPPTAGPG